jgi:hypothetical protein
MNRYFIPLIALGLLAGCATAPSPPLRADNPADPSAPEAPVRPLRNALGVDGLTKKSHQILAQAAKQQELWDQRGPDPGNEQDQQMQNMPGMQMPQPPEPSPSPQQNQMDQMPGMKMPGEQFQPSPTPNN